VIKRTLVKLCRSPDTGNAGNGANASPDICGERRAQWGWNKRLVRVPGKHQMDRFADRRPEMYDRITAPFRAGSHGHYLT